MSAMSNRFPFSPYPNGWFAIGFSSDFPPGQVITRRAFGEEIVLYRAVTSIPGGGDGPGALRAVEPHCPHLGAHLGHGGRVEGDRIRCPFHGWCFDGGGECVEVPGAARIPARARLRTWPVCERNGLAFVHYHARGEAPAWEIPALPTDEWTPDRTILWTVRTHPQEVFENVIDRSHLPPVHGVKLAEFEREPTCEGHRLSAYIHLVADGKDVGMPGMENDVLLDVQMHGLGQAFVHTHVRNVGITARQRIYCLPVDGERIEIRGAVNLRKLPDEGATAMIAELFYQAYVADFAMDFPIWENKVYRERPPLSSADGPFAWYRRWAQQFYDDAGGTALRVAT